jgi:hypothetical protein
MSSFNWVKIQNGSFVDNTGNTVDFSKTRIIDEKCVFMKFENGSPTFIDADKYQNKQGYEQYYILNILSNCIQYSLLINKKVYDMSFMPYLKQLSSQGYTLDQVETCIQCQIKKSTNGYEYKAYTFSMVNGSSKDFGNTFTNQSVTNQQIEPKPQVSMKEVLGEDLVSKARDLADSTSVSIPDLIKVALTEYVDKNTKRAPYSLDDLMF